LPGVEWRAQKAVSTPAVEKTCAPIGTTLLKIQVNLTSRIRRRKKNCGERKGLKYQELGDRKTANCGVVEQTHPFSNHWQSA
jgi:hypothetical protein